MKHFTQYILLISFSFFAMMPAGTSEADSNDNTLIYENLLTQYINNGQIDYSRFKEQEAQLDSYLDYLARTDPAQMKEKDRFAFYVNAYNA